MNVIVSFKYYILSHCPHFENIYIDNQLSNVTPKSIDQLVLEITGKKTKGNVL